MSDGLTSSLQWSAYLRRYLEHRPEVKQQLSKDCQATLTPSTIIHWLEAWGGSLTQFPPPDASTCSSLLRKLRTRVFNTLLVRDIQQRADFHEVVTCTSFLADTAIHMAYRTVMHTLVEAHGAPIDPSTGYPIEMIVIGMGKLGGEELNVSSDIDLIMLYSTEGDTTGRRPISFHEFYGKLTQRMMPILSHPEADGFVFRTDLRLRPDGEGSPLAWSLEALEHYLLSQGREWERYAWLKARIIPVKYFENSHPDKDYYTLESLRQPFVYRKYFDFDALSALRQLRKQIRQEWARKASSRSGLNQSQNIKLGEGGIREIEFIVQLIQLIRAGRMPSLQEKNLLLALKAEEEADLLPKDTVEHLKNAYLFLRRLEHFLQYYEDAQTHLLPADQTLLKLLAHALGLTPEDFDSTLKKHRDFVEKTFKNVFRLIGMQEDAPPSANEENQGNIASHIDTLFDASTQTDIQQHVSSLLTNYRIQQLSPSNQKRLECLIPLLLHAASHTHNPLLAIRHLVTLIETIAQRSAYIALLVEYPEILQRVARIMTASPLAAQVLIKNPLLLDSLIDWRTLLQPIDILSITEQLKKDLDACCLFNNEPDIEQQMNLMRDTQKIVSFQLLAQDLENLLSVEHLADHLSALADILLEESLKRTWSSLQKRSRHTLPDSPKFAIIAYGRLGGKELGYTSDLDLVLIFDDDTDDAPDTYAKLARRLSTWVSTMTSSGRLYDIDLRLRPDGDAGLLAVSIEGFEKYQHEMAWPWEHQALTRARFAAGDPTIGKKFEKIRRDILLKKRHLATLRQDIVKMRQKMYDGHPNPSTLFDIKHDTGGMVDIEFITQYLVLAYSHHHPKLLENLGNINLLTIAGEYGLIPSDLAIQCADAYRLFRKLQHEIRLRGEEKARIAAEQLSSEINSVKRLWRLVFVG